MAKNWSCLINKYNQLGLPTENFIFSVKSIQFGEEVYLNVFFSKLSLRFFTIQTNLTRFCSSFWKILAKPILFIWTRRMKFWQHWQWKLARGPENFCSKSENVKQVTIDFRKLVSPRIVPLDTQNLVPMTLPRKMRQWTEAFSLKDRKILSEKIKTEKLIVFHGKLSTCPKTFLRHVGCSFDNLAQKITLGVQYFFADILKLIKRIDFY